jgi:hypothetical protein
MPLTDQSVTQFVETVLAALAGLGELTLIAACLPTPPGVLDPAAVQRCQRWLPRSGIQPIYAELPGESGPSSCGLTTLTWPCSGFPDQVSGVDPANEEYADEQMNFGFSTGDEGIPEPYFYTTAYPWPEAIVTAPLPPGAIWHTEGWKGALLKYDSLLESGSAAEHLLSYLRSAYQAGSNLMR